MMNSLFLSIVMKLYSEMIGINRLSKLLNLSLNNKQWVFNKNKIVLKLIININLLYLRLKIQEFSKIQSQKFLSWKINIKIKQTKSNISLPKVTNFNKFYFWTILHLKLKSEINYLSVFHLMRLKFETKFIILLI